MQWGGGDKAPEFIGLLNNDIYFQKNWLETIINFIENTPDAGLVSPSLLGRKKHNLKKFINNKYNFKYKNAAHKVMFANFCCVLFRKNIVEEIGLLDENFTPAFYEDTDFSFRCTQAGKQNYELNNVYIFHNYSLTSSKLNKIDNIYKKNEQYYYKKNGYIAQYAWESFVKISTIKSSPFYKLITLEKCIKQRYEKIFRGLNKIIQK